MILRFFLTVTTDMLNDLFSQFDALTLKHGVHKVDTIGDAYLVCAGHESHTVDSTLRVTEFAMDMLRIVRSMKPPKGIDLQMRVGIHTGPAYSGVVGGKRIPKYTFFGDTINTASRMENTSWPGCINMSSFARQALESEITDREGISFYHWLSSLDAKIIYRDPIKIKGKGMMELSILCPNNAILLKNDVRLSHASLVTNISDPTNSTRLRSKAIVPSNESCLPKRRSAPDASLTPSEITVPTTDVSALLSQISELKLQLLVTTKSLNRARQDLIAKDDEINMIDLQLHKARRAPINGGPVIRNSVASTERISSSSSTHKKSFRAITEKLLDNDVPSGDMIVDRSQSPDALSSLGELAIDLDAIRMDFSSNRISDNQN